MTFFTGVIVVALVGGFSSGGTGVTVSEDFVTESVVIAVVADEETVLTTTAVDVIAVGVTLVVVEVVVLGQLLLLELLLVDLGGVVVVEASDKLL